MDKSKLMMIIIITLLVLLLGTVVAVIVYLMGMINNDNQDVFHEINRPEVQTQLGLNDLREIPLGDIGTNLAVSPDGRSAFVRADVIVGVNETGDAAELAEFEAEFTERMGFARSLVIQEFGSVTRESVRTPEGQAALAESIRLTLQQAFESPLIITVVFSNWALQETRQ